MTPDELTGVTASGTDTGASAGNVDDTAVTTDVTDDLTGPAPIDRSPAEQFGRETPVTDPLAY